MKSLKRSVVTVICGVIIGLFVLNCFMVVILLIKYPSKSTTGITVYFKSPATVVDGIKYTQSWVPEEGNYTSVLTYETSYIVVYPCDCSLVIHPLQRENLPPVFSEPLRIPLDLNGVPSGRVIFVSINENRSIRVYYNAYNPISMMLSR